MTPIHILETLFQHLGKLVMESVARARTAAARGTKSIDKDLKEIDPNVTMKAVKKMNKEDQGMLRTIQCGGGISKIELMEFGNGQSTECDYCGHQQCDLDHILWECPRFSLTRQQEDEQVGKMDPKYFNKAIKRGIAPAMRGDINTTYWGLSL